MDKATESFLARLGGKGGICLNCREREAKTGPICDVCSNKVRQFDNMLKEGITLKYADGTKETLKK
jgi:hypothetical protein